jgi:ABC-type glycerol-3-phosphate transport system permease component
MRQHRNAPLLFLAPFLTVLGVPVMQAGLVTVALLCFVGAWNNFFLPLIVLNQDSLYPLTLGLNVWNSVSSAGGRPVYNLIAMGSLISVLPLLIAFVVLGKYWRRLNGGRNQRLSIRHICPRPVFPHLMTREPSLA